MKNIIFYSYLKCSSCRKAANWLKSKDFEFQLIDIVKEPPLVSYLNLALEKYSDDKKMFLIQEVKTFKNLILIFIVYQGKKLFNFFLSDSKLIKRPFLIYEEKKVILGLNEIEYAKQFI